MGYLRVGRHRSRVSVTAKRRSRLSTTDGPPPGLHPPSHSSTLISQTCHQPVNYPSSPRPPRTLGTAARHHHLYAGNLLRLRFSQEGRDGRGRCPRIPPGRGRAFTSHRMGTIVSVIFHTRRKIILRLYPPLRRYTSMVTNPRSPAIPSPLPRRIGVGGCKVRRQD